MPSTIYRDQVERFYDLEEAAQHVTAEIAALCSVSPDTVKHWRSKSAPRPEEYPVRPPHEPDLPPLRPPAMPIELRPPWAMRIRRAVRPQAQQQVSGQRDDGQTLGGDASDPPSMAPHSRRDALPADTAGFVLAEKTPKPYRADRERAEEKLAKARADAEAIRQKSKAKPVTQGKVEAVVEKAIKKQRAEMLAEIRAAGFDPRITWSTEVDEVSFNPVRALVQLAHAPGVPENVVLGILKELVRLRKERARIAWERVELADIPQEHRPRLAGQLADWLDTSELPEVAQAPEATAIREVYELTGVVVPGQADAAAFLLRWDSILEQMQQDAARLVPDPNARTAALVMDGPPKMAAEFKVVPATARKPA